MTLFRVKVDYAEGVWVKDHPHPIVEVLATSAKAAAELACGTTLRDSGHPSKYRAQVWPLGGVRHTREIKRFYCH